MTGGLLAANSVRPWAELERAACGIAEGLRERGVRTADRVLLCGDNSAEYVLVLLALMRLGASIVLTDHRQTPQEARRAADVAQVRWTVADAGVATSAGRRLEITELVEDRPDAGTAELSLRDWYCLPDGLITWSSGTRGPAKGVVRSGKSFLDNVERSRRRMGYRPDDVLMPLLPFSHQYGLSMVLLWWQVRCSLLVAPYRRLDHALELGGRWGATVLDATPMTYHSVLNLGAGRPGLLSALRTVRMWCVGGSPLSPALADRFRAATGRPLLDGYGSTETGNIALAAPGDETGCGHPLDAVEVLVLDTGGAVAAPGRLGEIAVQSPDLTSGYLEPDGGVRPLPPGPHRTGDVGFVDEDGHVFVLGRRGAVHRMGHTLYPDVLAHKAAACGAPVHVLATEDERTGCQLVFVVADPRLRAGGYWRRRIQDVLPSYEHPNRVVVVEEMPLNSNGKPDTGQLDRLLRGTASGGASSPAVPAQTRRGPTPRNARIPFAERLDALRAVEDFLRNERGAVLDVLTEISPLKTAESELASSLATLAGARAEVERHGPRRLSRLAVFMPSNVLCYSYVLYLLVPALYAERIAFRASAQVGAPARRLHELLAPVHGLPVHPHQVSQRRFVDEPVSEADVVVFTGAYDNAEQIRSRLRPEQLMLFFGQGVNPFVVASGADLDLAVADAVRIRMLNSGQDCFGPDVFLVDAAEADRFVELLVKRLGELRYGDYRDADADYGPLFYDSALQKATEYLRRNHERIVFGGRVDLRDRHLHPTVLVRSSSDDLVVEELFSPIFNVVVHHDREQLRAVLRTPFVTDRAMAAMVYGDDPETVELLARRHQVCHNRSILDAENGNRPFGGHGIVANYAAHRGRRVAEPLLVSKAVADHLSAASDVIGGR
ncbi:acyl-CoA synthetase (AMP-forming)/AMP-acid ligase II [Saccharopolyspora erythraea NRRL 2338]|uniref:Uncharacterized protein n=2 Tax=Saccharopolyspora erythraea TaxID=1836 RepID=A4F7C4_SACEN|nr:aldehyde dehydrogenase family protein [Saccharopolyspora erythraea]EQD83615.1 hypothetical protein N599_24380 [Saccharopolyspora erythraea D]PFG93750.1 acyl-CoA synthetase (AMP-forming)/AMP-acid ligase II [Saccharopolyspora erythraea NRRL 2338]QRK90587.1 aldehyde dehydrogenase family protein [Saccharopolyspora erythraea]CAL99948.1 hypothetical protein SACE_0603 [Saccharopolyspora erythraea NRRL 2338]